MKLPIFIIMDLLGKEVVHLLFQVEGDLLYDIIQSTWIVKKYFVALMFF